jgi:hypothetical protein
MSEHVAVVWKHASFKLDIVLIPVLVGFMWRVT